LKRCADALDAGRVERRDSEPEQAGAERAFEPFVAESAAVAERLLEKDV